MLLANLRASGLKVAADGDALIVEPRGSITDQARAIIRTHKHSILQELARECVEHRKRVGAALEAARLEDFRASLILGRLHLCANCAQFTFDTDPASPGTCAVFAERLAPFAPFKCVSFHAADAPAAPLFLPDALGTLAAERELTRQDLRDALRVGLLPADLPFDDPIPDLAGGAQL